MKASYCLLGLLLLTRVDPILAQRGVSQSDMNTIRSLLGPSYRLSDVTNVDSVSGIPGKYGSIVSDAFGTLGGCLILTVEGKRQSGSYYPRGFIAVYRNGSIIWRSDTLINSRSVFGGGSVLDIRDLNRDGTIDITTNWLEGRASGGAEYLWIFSWDGVSGSLISDYDPPTGKSTLVSVDGFLTIIDSNGDGIVEFRGEWPEGTSIEYRWDGLKYTGNGGAPPPPLEGQVPRDKLNVRISARVVRINSDFQFQYNVFNDASSLQAMDDLLIYPLNSVGVAAKGRERWKAVPGRWTNFFFEANFLRPGEKDSTFLLQGPGPISITQFFAQGHNGTSYSGDKILLNSFRGFTIAPSALPQPVDPVDFLDSLYLYTSQLSGLGWINLQSVADKYLGYLGTARVQLDSGNIGSARLALQQILDGVIVDSVALTSEAYALLRHNTEYLLDHLPAASAVSTYSLFATHSLWLEQNSDMFSGDIGVNETGNAPFLDSQVELSVGIGTSTASGYSIKGNRIKVKQGSTVGSDVYYNELDNNGTIAGTLHTPLTLPLTTSLPEFKPATPGTQNITIPQNGTQTLEPGSYGDILVRRNGKLTFTGGTYHLASLNTGDNVQLLFQSSSEVRVGGKFDTDQGTYIGPQDTTSLTASQIVFYVGGINGSNGNLGTTPKAAQIGLSNTVKANFYVPNGTLWIRQNSQATGAFIGKDVDVGIGVKIWHKSAF